jgi:transposase
MLIAVLREQNVVLAERCAGLEEQNERLTARVAELERRLDRNSKNSNFPPSQDVFGLPKDETTAAKPKPAAKRGKRKGAPGAGLAMVESPDRVEEHRPGACSDCGEGLGGVPSVGFARRQVSPLVPSGTPAGVKTWGRCLPTAADRSLGR